jgi:toluene monooxygenase system ferredoxin subunit
MTNSADGAWHRACARTELPPGEKREVQLGDGTFALIVSTADGIFACCADCPHLDTPLIDAAVDGTVITCPEHLWQWDLRTGEPIGLAEMPLPLFETREEDGVVFVRKCDGL